MTVALQALIVTLRDSSRAERLLSLSGLSADELRTGTSDPAMLAEVLRFLEAHEPDLIAVAEELDFKPEELVRARSALEA
ncbi:MAG TPA: DUF3572 family protein [Sphingomicrobium sp.]|nr:DUF3572 family protein [Sphingomicrobium sp.]